MSCTKLIVTAGGLPPSKTEYEMCKFPGVARAAAKVNVGSPARTEYRPLESVFQRTRLLVNNPSQAFSIPQKGITSSAQATFFTGVYDQNYLKGDF